MIALVASSSLDSIVLSSVPAFMVGAAFGALVGIILAGEGVSSGRVWEVTRRSAIGSAIGVVLFVLTAPWWPPPIGPFVTCPATAILAAMLFQPKG